MDELEAERLERRRELEDALTAVVEIEQAVGVPVENMVAVLDGYLSVEELAYLQEGEDD
jgi:2-oxoglutarate dehydrogenase complex dehydrogenase (E1) component-like enzyme